MILFSALLLAMQEPSTIPVPSSAGTVSVRIVQAAGLSAPMQAAFVNAAGQAFSDRGFTALDGTGHARFAAEINVSRDQVGTTTTNVARSASALQTGEGTSVVGAGVSLALPTKKSRVVPLERTRMQIEVRRAGDERIFWKASAVTVRPATTPQGSDERVAADLSGAMLRAYPEQSDEVISVP